MSSLSKDLLKSLMQTASTQDSEQNQLLSENFLGSVAKMWASGKLSNFDYIMLLNYLCGRTFNNPNHYHVVPWVRLNSQGSDHTLRHYLKKKMKNFKMDTNFVKRIKNHLKFLNFFFSGSRFHISRRGLARSDQIQVPTEQRRHSVRSDLRKRSNSSRKRYFVAAQVQHWTSS